MSYIIIIHSFLICHQRDYYVVLMVSSSQRKFLRHTLVFHQLQRNRIYYYIFIYIYILKILLVIIVYCVQSYTHVTIIKIAKRELVINSALRACAVDHCIWRPLTRSYFTDSVNIHLKTEQTLKWRIGYGRQQRVTLLVENCRIIVDEVR